jgi:hypothetical protein
LFICFVICPNVSCCSSHVSHTYSKILPDWIRDRINGLTTNMINYQLVDWPTEGLTDYLITGSMKVLNRVINVRTQRHDEITKLLTTNGLTGGHNKIQLLLMIMLNWLNDKLTELMGNSLKKFPRDRSDFLRDWMNIWAKLSDRLIH